jgi:hypothetical protein
LQVFPYDGTYTALFAYCLVAGQEIFFRAMLTGARGFRLTKRARNKEQVMENLMDSKYNKYLDSAMVRIGLLAVGFSAWLGVGVAVLKAAA